MVTVIIVFFGVLLVGGLVLLVLKSGMKSGRPNQAEQSAVEKQHEQGGGGRPVV